MENKDFLGNGMKFPPQVNQATGKFELISDEACIRQSVYLILMTLKDERFLHPDFGSNLPAYVFMEKNSSMLNFLSLELERDIKRAEPRIENVEVRVESSKEEECLMVSVNYTIRKTNHRDNLVFPFYIHKEEGSL